MYPDPFTAVDLADLSSTTFIDEVDYHDEIDSTNTLAAALRHRVVLPTARHAPRPRRPSNRRPRPRQEPVVVRPRRPHFLRPAPRPQLVTLPKHRWPLVALTTGWPSAARSISVSAFATPAPMRSSQSPDQMAERHLPSARKLGGILVEAATGPAR